jgi:hypothetical protein
VKKTLITGALAAATIVAAPAFAQQASRTDRSVNERLDALSRRVDKLEQDKAKLESDNAELKEKNERLEATTEYLRSNASATRKELAEDAANIAKIPDLEKSAKASEWASKLTWKGDFRYRHENVDPEEAVTDQSRERIRARFGVTAKINDTVSATLQLATNGGNNDPRSTNQTLGSGFDRKGVAFDLAYVDWKAADGLNVLLGKMPQPFTKAGSYFWDNDITPEGGALKYTRGMFFANAYGFVLGERSTASDPTVIGAQFGAKLPVGPNLFTAAISYYDVGAVTGKVTAQPTGCTAAANPAFFGGAQGNTTVTVAGCPRLLNDYNIIQVMGQFDMKLGSHPLSIFADVVQNQEADDLDTGYSAGVTFNKAGDPQTWEVGYVYQKTEKDATFAQFIDSDFGGGVTDVDGSVFKFSYAPAKNWLFNGTYFLNDRFIDVGTQRDYKRYQLDLAYKF